MNSSPVKLHVVSFDIPYPANYGGVIDVFYKLKALFELGVEIILHCFAYGRQETTELNRYCKEVHYYPRKTGLLGFQSGFPYIISSRRSKKLLANLQMVEAPILFEGIHCTYYSQHPSLSSRLKILRAHNIEHDYYADLASHHSGWKKWFFNSESKKLKQYEDSFHTDRICCISQNEMSYFKTRSDNTTLLPAFHPNNQVNSLLGRGTYCLFHGNFEVAENLEAALYLCKEVFTNLEIPLIVAGKNPPNELKQLESNFIHIIANPKEDHMRELVRDAQVNVLPAFQSHGVKLKLLHALFAGRFCITNAQMLLGSGIEQSVLLAESSKEIQELVQHYLLIPFTEKDLQIRKEALALYQVKQNAAQLVEWITPKS